MDFGIALAPAVDAWQTVEHAERLGFSHVWFSLQLHNLMWVRPEEERFVTPELIRMATFTVTAAALRERVRTMAAAGYQQLAIQVVPGQGAALEDWAQLPATV